MKRNISNFILTIFTMGLLLTGCGGGEGDLSSETPPRQAVESGEATDEQAKDSEASEGQAGASQVVGGQAEGSATSDASGEQASGDAGAEQEGNPEEEPYIVSFEATTVDGEEITSEIFANSKLTMLNVWATYCNPCLQEMPDLGEIAASYDTAEFQLIGVVSDVAEGASEDDIAYAQELITQTNAAYPHIILSESLYINLVGAVEAVPTTFFINREGELLGYAVGAQSKEAWEELIKQILAECE